ncbi:hypothetical protein E2C01_098365 [Portunus trituberculatus]|uniref:Uncharacterized protein n=1 Tax=Portunus trituberculatus TaxID=210409 RepID=A0A5B7JXM4_PORTR|nr:hypothetical protein [Portunus trituberculatus]
MGAHLVITPPNDGRSTGGSRFTSDRLCGLKDSVWTLKRQEGGSGGPYL